MHDRAARDGRRARFARSYGGDTLNTAIYLARLGVAVDYVTALGDDPWSDEMIAGWAAEGVGTEQVARVPGRVPGLYIIQTDARERSMRARARSSAFGKNAGRSLADDLNGITGQILRSRAAERLALAS
jgi:2-dehydro-3-deoxygluconokinase